MRYLLTISIILTLCIYDGVCRQNRDIQNRLKQATDRFIASLGADVCANIILNATVRRQYVSHSLIGRVEPLGTFLTTKLALEYVYGLLCPIPNLPSRAELIETVNLLQLTYDPNHYLVSFIIRLNLQSSKKLLFIGMLAFDKELLLCGYQAVVQNAGLTFDIPSALYPYAISNLCAEIQAACPVNSSNEQYANVSDCMSFLSEPQTPFGTYDQADQDSVVCRLVHIQLAQISPHLHCPHVGKTGGRACVNKTAESYFQGTTNFVQCAYRYSK